MEKKVEEPRPLCTHGCNHSVSIYSCPKLNDDNYCMACYTIHMETCKQEHRKLGSYYHTIMRDTEPIIGNGIGVAIEQNELDLIPPEPKQSVEEMKAWSELLSILPNPKGEPQLTLDPLNYRKILSSSNRSSHSTAVYVVGDTGSGKSFLTAALTSVDVTLGDGFTSQTSGVHVYTSEILPLVDIPAEPTADQSEAPSIPVPNRNLPLYVIDIEGSNATASHNTQNLRESRFNIENTQDYLSLIHI
eukprot:TRINITY_DN9149_c0_g2_i1.p1 TRINITY_DN9149_c0_g2~~TRINITY_DN9149_c0_g2_i1.p1  ORF type:complete len:246 (+),score=5.69 TRINITY_DN9149_c0_g2_i1:1-738(+)